MGAPPSPVEVNEIQALLLYVMRCSIQSVVLV